MARCSYHPNVETEMRCAECGKPICPKEMVLTPVGYKCPEDARPKRSQYVLVKPKQLLTSVAAAIALGVISGGILSAVRFGGLFLGLLWGTATAEVIRRASGGHRGGTVGAVAVLSIAVAWLVGFFFGGISLLTVIIAAAVALVQLAAFGDR